MSLNYEEIAKKKLQYFKDNPTSTQSWWSRSIKPDASSGTDLTLDQLRKAFDMVASGNSKITGTTGFTTWHNISTPLGSYDQDPPEIDPTILSIEEERAEKDSHILITTQICPMCRFTTLLKLEYSHGEDSDTITFPCNACSNEIRLTLQNVSPDGVSVKIIDAWGPKTKPKWKLAHVETAPVVAVTSRAEPRYYEQTFHAYVRVPNEAMTSLAGTGHIRIAHQIVDRFLKSLEKQLLQELRKELPL